MATAEVASLDFYAPQGSNLAACESGEQEVILTGPLGTGKTRALMEKVHRLCNVYRDIKVLLLRKRETDLAGSALEMFRDYVAGPELASGAVRFVNRTRDEPARYEYQRSGSVIVVGGLWPPPQKTKVTNSAWDIIAVPAVNELEESDWELLLPLCHNGALPVNQLIGECEPQDDEHWILKRAERGNLRLIEGAHEDNPRWFTDGALNAQGVAFMAKLDALSDVTLLRNRYGYWVKRAGLCLPSYNRDRHVIDPLDTRAMVSWQWDWSIDFGKVHPFSFGMWATNPGGLTYLVKQIYMTGRETGEHCEDILYLAQHFPQPTNIITDHAANDRLICQRIFNREVTPADKRVLEGIDYLDRRFQQNKLFIFNDSLYEVDQALKAKGLPTCLQDEIPRYVWQKGKRSREGPVKKWDDAVDMARYHVVDLDAPDEYEVHW